MAGCLIPRSWSDPEGVKELAYPRALPLIEHLASAASEATARTRAETFRLPSAGAARRIVEALAPA